MTARKSTMETITYKKKLKQRMKDCKVVSTVMQNVQDGRSWKRDKIDDKIIKWENDYSKAARGNEQDGRSKVVDDTVHNYVESVVTNIQEPITNTSDLVRLTSNNNQEDVIRQAELEEKLINFQFTKRIDKFTLFEESVKLFVRQGVVCTKSFWNHKVKQLVANSLYEGKEGVAEYDNISPVEYEQLQVAHKELGQYPVGLDVEGGLISVTFVYDNIIHENPDFYNVPITNMFWDPTAKKVSFTDHDFTYAGEVKVMTQSEIRQKITTDDTYRDFSKDELDQLFATSSDDALAEGNTGIPAMDGNIDGYYNALSSEVLKGSKGKHVVIEYHGYMDIDKDNINELVHVEILNNKIIKLSLNEYLDDMIPYNVAIFDRTPFTISGESIASYLEDVQYLRTAIARGMHDSIAYGMLQNYAIEDGDLSPLEQKKMAKRKPGEFIKFRKNRGRSLRDRLVPIQSEGIKPEYLTMYSLLEQQAQENSGITAYTQGLNSDSLNQTATGVSIIHSASMKRMWRYATTFIETEIKQMIKAARIMNKMLLDETKFTVGDDTYTVSKDMLDVDSDINVNVAIKGFDSEKVTQAIQLLNMTQPLVQMGVVSPEVLTELVKEISEIWDMRSIANMIKPVPNPPQPGGDGGQGTQSQNSGPANSSMGANPMLSGNNTMQQI